LLLLMAPACPHVAEELWSQTGRPYSIHQQQWPESIPELTVKEVITLVVQVNGRVRARLEVPADIGEEEAREAALAEENVQRYTEGRQIKRVIYVPGRLVNIVV
ncbi:MAG: class I tRNA ligase family protein, partial [Anaerolineae bacterium]